MKTCIRGKELNEQRCFEVLLTPDGLGKEQKMLALGEYVAKLQRQKFLLETRIADYVRDRKNWLEGTDNAALRQRIKELETTIKDQKAARKLKDASYEAEIARLNKVIAEKETKPQPVIETKVEPTKTKKQAYNERHANFQPKEIPSDYIAVFFDGGTGSNVPPFGDGYGSYCINGKIERLQFGARMSANVAEIKTAIEALKHLQRATHGNYKVWMVGDSQIALNWIEAIWKKKDRKLSKTATELFKHTIGELRTTIESNLRITDLVTEWRPRRFSVALLGH